ncbi:MAG: chloride channel protein [Spirosomataceae bacterium]
MPTSFFFSKNKWFTLYELSAQWLIALLFVGVVSGSSSALFLYSLERITLLRGNYPFFLYALPFVGLFIGWFYQKGGDRVGKGNNLILEEINVPTQQKIPLKMSLWVLVGTLLTHLSGGSAGREGTAVQMSASLSDQFPLKRFYRVNRSIFLRASIAAGFASVFGTPLAGILFALEVPQRGKIAFSALVPCLIAAFWADTVCHFWGATHSVYPTIAFLKLDIQTLGKLAIASICFALSSWLFIQIGELVTKKIRALIPDKRFQPFWGGLILLICFLVFPLDELQGLGLPTLSAAFEQTAAPYLFLGKLVFTAFTLSVGFKGGEVTPLFFIGATLGSYLASVLGIPTDYLAALGFIGVFAGATKTPWACVFIGYELFGAANSVAYLFICFSVYFLSGENSIYTAQRKS